MTSLLWLLLVGGIAGLGGFWCGVRSQRGETTFWRGRSDYWFNSAMTRYAEWTFHHHPHHHATQWATLDELVGGRVVEDRD